MVAPPLGDYPIFEPHSNSQEDCHCDSLRCERSCLRANMNDSQLEPQWRYGDLREWLRETEKLGELKTVLGASWQEEIGLASDVVIPSDDGPAVIFDEVPGCPKGFQLLINVFAGKRRAMTLGFPQGLTKQELSQAYFDHYQKKQHHISPVIVEDGPIFENVLTGDAVDINKFPTPIWHVNDGGRYIGTGCYSVTMDPDERWINVGCYRAMIQDQRSVSLLIVPVSMVICIGRNIFAAERKCRW